MHEGQTSPQSGEKTSLIDRIKQRVRRYVRFLVLIYLETQEVLTFYILMSCFYFQDELKGRHFGVPNPEDETLSDVTLPEDRVAL